MVHGAAGRGCPSAAASCRPPPPCHSPAAAPASLRPAQLLMEPFQVRRWVLGGQRRRRAAAGVAGVASLRLPPRPHSLPSRATQVTSVASRIVGILYGFLATVLINTCAQWELPGARCLGQHPLACTQLPVAHARPSTSARRLRQPGGGSDHYQAANAHQWCRGPARQGGRHGRRVCVGWGARSSACFQPRCLLHLSGPPCPDPDGSAPPAADITRLGKYGIAPSELPFQVRCSCRACVC